MSAVVTTSDADVPVTRKRGPGACWLYVRPGLVETLRTPDTGWFAKKDMFTYARPEPPEFGPGGDAWLESTSQLSGFPPRLVS